MSQRVYKLSNLTCGSCAKMIELDFEDIGVDAVCNCNDQTLIVKKGDITEARVLEVIKRMGVNIQTG